MDASKIKIFICAVINYGHLGFLDLDNQDLLCFYEECLIMAKYLGDRSLMTAVLKLLGQLYAEKFSSTESSTHLENLFKKIKMPEGFWDRTFQIIAYQSISEAYYNLCKYSEVIAYQKKQLNISREMGNSERKELEGKVYKNLQECYIKLYMYDKVFKYSQKHLDIARELDDKNGEGLSLLGLGNAMLHFGQIQKAIEYFDNSLSVAKETDDNIMERCCYINLGRSYNLLGKTDDALTYFQKSLEVCTEKDDKEGQAISLSSLGEVYQKSGKYKEAINYHKKSLNIAKEIGNKDAEGMAYSNLGGISWALGKYYDANLYLDKALKIFQEIGNRRGEGQVYEHLSGLYTCLGKRIVANQYIEKNVDIIKEIGGKHEQVHAYIGMGISKHGLGKFEEAIPHFKKSMEIATEIGDIHGKGIVLRCLGNTYRWLGKYDKSIERLNKSLIIAKEVCDKEGEALAYRELGSTCISCGKLHEAIQQFQNSVDVSSDKRNKGSSFHMLGKTYHKISYCYDEPQHKEQYQHAMERSIYFLKEALQCSDWQFQHLQTLDELKISLSELFIPTYKLLTTVMIKDQQFEEALLVCDRGRGRALGDLLNLKYGVNPQDVLTSTTPLQYADVTTMLAGNTFCVMFLAVSDQDVNIWILTHQNPVFFVKSEGVLSLVKSSQSEERNQIKMEELLTKVINNICLSIKVEHSRECENRSLEPPLNSHAPRTDIVDEMETSSVSAIGRERNIAPIEVGTCSPLKADPLKFLFGLLVSPVLQYLEQEEIVIIPDGPLYTVPFAALRDPTTGSFLSETKRIRLAPSLASLKTLQDCQENHHCKTGALIVGDPDVGEVMLRGEKKIIPRLQSAKLEAEIIGEILKVKPLTGSEATKEIVKQKLLEGVAVIHIAAHGDSEKGHIALAPSTLTKATRIPEEEDYMLTMQEVQEMGVRAQLVVLSCCHSGRGEIKAEGVVGMSRAFLAAGACAVVASLWAIDDEATKTFMVSFYTYLHMGESASTSLQKAMKDLREEEGYDEPEYWAPFFLIGDDVTISV